MDYNVGDTWVVRTTFMRLDPFTWTRAPENPGSVVYYVKPPTLPEYSISGPGSVINVGTGVYFAEIPLDAPGFWRVRVVGTDPAKGMQETSILVPDNEFQP